MCHVVIGQNVNIFDSSTNAQLEQRYARLDPEGYVNLLTRENYKPAQSPVTHTPLRASKKIPISRGLKEKKRHKLSISGIIKFVQRIFFIAAYAILIPALLMMLPGVVGFYLVIWNKSSPLVTILSI